MSYAQHFAKRAPIATPQMEPIPGREAEQVKNNASGFVFSTGDWLQLDRFLVLGSEGGSYYAGEREMTIDNAKAVERCIAADGPRVVNRIVEISDAGRAPKNDPALFALALCASAAEVKTRQAALVALPKVARIGTHLFHFAEMVSKQRGWGRALRAAIARWYNAMPIDRLVMQAVKYQQRDGWSHRDLLRLSHPNAKTAPAASEVGMTVEREQRAAIYDWICGRKPSLEVVGPTSLLRAYDYLKADPNPAAAVDAIQRHRMPREGLPTELLNDVSVWRALLDGMPLTAMIRNLGKMTSIGLLKPLSDEVDYVVKTLTDVEALRRARIHPIALLIALKTYAAGHGDKGKLSWAPVSQITDALDEAFYLAFQTVEPTGRRIMLAVDISGSMGSGSIAGTSLTPREGAAALALVTAATEPRHVIMGFATSFMALNISAKDRLDRVVSYMERIPMGGTDCSLPWLSAMRHDLDLDAVITITDNETWAGHIHASQAVKQYRDKTGIPARNIVIGMTATKFTVNDPADPLGLDVVGFDAAVPAVISDFIRG